MNTAPVRPRPFCAAYREGESPEEYRARWDREEAEYLARFKEDIGRFAEAFVRCLADKPEAP